MRFVIVSLWFSLVLASSAYAEPGLKVGAKAPEISTEDIDGNAFDLAKARSDGPVVVVFYRGGWCPYCNKQLQSLAKEVVPKLKEYSAELVAISVDKPEKAKETAKTKALGMTVLSDSDTKLIEAYKVVHKVEEEIVIKLKEKKNVDLEEYAGGRKHHKIAVPAVYVIDSDGVIRYAYVNPDYKVRAANQDILNSLAGIKSR